MTTRPLQDAPELEVTSSDKLRAWLAAHHGRAAGVWLVTWKKARPEFHVSTAEIVRECLAVGWVDSLPRSKDADRTMLYISPRKPGSNWSRVNKEHVARLEAEGRMTGAGRAVVARAQADGSWSALDGVEALQLPPDLAAAFDATPGTEEAWHRWPRSVKRGALEILLNARRPATREAKIAEILRCAQTGERPFQWRGRS